MAYHFIMVAGLVAAFAIPLACGMSDSAMIASGLCFLSVSLAMFFGVLNLKKDGGTR